VTPLSSQASNDRIAAFYGRRHRLIPGAAATRGTHHEPALAFGIVRGDRRQVPPDCNPLQ
jgi:hypothetical protein